MKLFGILAFLLLLFGEPYAEAVAYRKFTAAGTPGGHERVVLYRAAFFRTWAIALVLLAAVVLAHYPVRVLGLTPFNLARFESWPVSGRVAIAIVMVVYVLYNLLPIVLPLLGEVFKQEVAKRLEYVVDITPVGTKETAWWIANSFTSVMEELTYRGFVFFIVKLWWPGAPLVALIVISSVLDGARYYHRPAAALNVFLTGVAFSLFYVIFGSIYAAMIAHVLHDLRPLAFPMATVRANLARRATQAQLASQP